MQCKEAGRLGWESPRQAVVGILLQTSILKQARRRWLFIFYVVLRAGGIGGAAYTAACRAVTRGQGCEVCKAAGGKLMRWTKDVSQTIGRILVNSGDGYCGVLAGERERWKGGKEKALDANGLYLY